MLGRAIVQEGWYRFASMGTSNMWRLPQEDKENHEPQRDAHGAHSAQPSSMTIEHGSAQASACGYAQASDDATIDVAPRTRGPTRARDPRRERDHRTERGNNKLAEVGSLT